MAQQFTNNARALLTASITNTATTIVIEATKADLFPIANVGTGSLPSASNWFKVTLQDSSGNVEIVAVRTRTAGSGILSNVIRGYDGTTALAFVSGTVAGLRITAEDVQTALDLPNQNNVFTGDNSFSGTNEFTGTQTFSGVTSFSDDVTFNDGATGNLTGNVTGNLTGNVTGTVNLLTVGRGGGNVATNTAVGFEALQSNTSEIGDNNTAVGYQALKNTFGNALFPPFNIPVGFSNTAVGSSALQNNSEGWGNTAVGNEALQNNTTASANTAVGYTALKDNTTGSYNVAVGQESLYGNTTGENNTATGRAALKFNTTGSDNTACGDVALFRNTSGVENTAVGRVALGDNTTGSYNTALGLSALSYNTTGTFNTAVGYYALSFDTTKTNIAGFGYAARVTGNNQVQLGNSSTTTYVYGTVQNRSDLRDKADVRDTVLGLSFINALRPVDYKWDMRDDYRPERPADLPDDSTPEQEAAHKAEMAAWLEASKHDNLVSDGSKKRNRYHHGLIAQEVKQLLDAQGIDFGGYQDHKVAGGDDVLSIGYDELIAPLIKAIQELTARVKQLEQGANT
jgi:hypothetical protein